MPALRTPNQLIRAALDAPPAHRLPLAVAARTGGMRSRELDLAVWDLQVAALAPDVARSAHRRALGHLQAALAQATHGRPAVAR